MIAIKRFGGTLTFGMYVIFDDNIRRKYFYSSWLSGANAPLFCFKLFY